MAAQGAARLGGLSTTDTPYHCMQKTLLYRPSYFGLHQNVRGGLGEVAGGFMKT